MVLSLEQYLTGGGQATHDREVVMAERNPQARRVATWGVGADGCRQKIKAGFVDPDDGPPLGLGFA